MSKMIEVTVDAEGNVTVEAIGFKGKGCTTATEFIEKALGTPGKKKLKPEYHQQAGTQQQIGG